jgi:small subunit ribosomal protein S5
MTDEKNIKVSEPEETVPEVIVEDVVVIPEEKPIIAAKGILPDKNKGRRSFGFKRGGVRLEKKDEFDQRILEIARVTRVMAGGKRMRFRACVAIGDKKGRVGVGVGKGADVSIAVNKAVNRAKKEMIDVPVFKDTIPHQVYNKYCASKILLKPAGKGRGVVAGGVTRVIMELAGVRNVSSKSLGSNNKISSARCVIEAIKKLRRVEQPAARVDNNKKEEKKEENNKVKNNK